jgi:fimbrial chaperone protein
MLKVPAVLTVHNEEDTPVLVQATVLAWQQVNGEDQLDATRDLLVTPPVFTLAPKSDQVLRVALRGQASAERELDYRLLLAEVPGPPTGVADQPARVRREPACRPAPGLAPRARGRWRARAGGREHRHCAHPVE